MSILIAIVSIILIGISVLVGLNISNDEEPQISPRLLASCWALMTVLASIWPPVTGTTWWCWPLVFGAASVGWYITWKRLRYLEAC